MKTKDALSMKTKDTLTTLADYISKGHSRDECIEMLVETTEMTRGSAYNLYHKALKQLLPDPKYMDDLKQTIIQQNLDRLEKIVNSSINGNTQEKKVALQAIDTLNKMFGAYADKNQVTIAKDNSGDEVIQITFSK